MKNKKNKNNGNCVKTPVTCIEWNLPGIPCLGIETGDMLDDVTFALVEKICSSLQGTDLSNVDLQCIIDKLNVTEPAQKTIQTLLQIAFDNDCKLYDLIQEVRAIALSNTPTLSLDLKCLAQIDSYGNQLSYNQQSVFQLLLNEACAVRNQLAALSLSFASLQQQVNNLPDPYTEPTIPPNCVHSTSQILSNSVTLLASDYCSYKGNVGSPEQINSSIGKQPVIVDVTDPLFNNPELVFLPTSMAEDNQNQWIFIKSLLGRLRDLEKCACQVKCSDITIGFIVVFEDDNTATLRFTNGAGSNIPAIFTDCGSILTISGSSGMVAAPIDLSTINDGIAQNVELEGIDVSMFEPGELLTFDINVNLCSEGQSCQKCVSRTVKNTSGCCTITASGPVTIIYQTCGLTP